MNFLDIDNFITSFLHKNIELYEKNKYKIDIFNKMKMENIGGKIRDDIEKDIFILNNLKFSENILWLYKRNTSQLITNFLNILNTPINKNSIDKILEAEKQKKKLLNLYMNIIKKCIPYDIYKQMMITDENNISINVNFCQNCENTESFIKENDILICKVCFSEVVRMTYFNNRSFNLSVHKCNYDRISHFKECLKQYQGKQNTFISPDVYKDLEYALKINSLLNENSTNKQERFSRVKKMHIIYFLKELGYSKHYDDYVLIYSNLTGKPPNNISDIEDVLIADFENISETYYKLYNNIERKNFINIQFILYKLLRKHNYPYEEDDFLTIKTTEKKMERDKICRTIFQKLNWEYK